MVKVYLTLICFCISCFMACVEQPKVDLKSREQVTETSTTDQATLSIMNVDNRLYNADSLVIVFYKDPHGTDSLRYTRFYTQCAVTESDFIRLLTSQLAENAEMLEKVKQCRSEGKIWCFSGGEIFQTIYFSGFNSQCNFMYIIKNGLFYYCRLNPDFSTKLNAYKKLATDPTGQPVK